MPRRSTASFSVVRPDPVVTLPRPSAAAPADIVTLFNQIVASVPATHFRSGDAPLIEQYAQAIALAQRAYAELATSGPVTADGRASAWAIILEKAHRSSVALAGRLRLAPQSRADSRSAGRQQDGMRPSVYEILRDDAK